MNLLQVVNDTYKTDLEGKIPYFKSGDTVSVHVQISEGGKTRIQVFQGTCIATKKRGDINGHFRVRKISNGMGVERVFPYHSPVVKKVEVIAVGKTRRAKHYYLRERSGKSARISTDYSDSQNKKKA